MVSYINLKKKKFLYSYFYLNKLKYVTKKAYIEENPNFFKYRYIRYYNLRTEKYLKKKLKKRFKKVIRKNNEHLKHFYNLHGERSLFNLQANFVKYFKNRFINYFKGRKFLNYKILFLKRFLFSKRSGYSNILGNKKYKSIRLRKCLIYYYNNIYNKKLYKNNLLLNYSSDQILLNESRAFLNIMYKDVVNKKTFFNLKRKKGRIFNFFYKLNFLPKYRKKITLNLNKILLNGAFVKRSSFLFLFIRETRSNVFVSLTNRYGSILKSFNCGFVLKNFNRRKEKKEDVETFKRLGLFIGKEVNLMKKKYLKIVILGNKLFKRNFVIRFIINGLYMRKIRVISILDNSVKAHNGVRAKKPKRR